MSALITLFNDAEVAPSMEAFRLLARLFSERRAVAAERSDEDEKVKAKDPKSVPSDFIQNQSDPDASFSGRKGQRYQAQLMETRSETKEDSEKIVNLITRINFELARERDSLALSPIIEGRKNPE
jgi:hypothetical protein